MIVDLSGLDIPNPERVRLRGRSATRPERHNSMLRLQAMETRDLILVVNWLDELKQRVRN
jgi:hypothetical protein